MAERISPLVAKPRGVGRAADSDAVHHEDEGAAHAPSSGPRRRAISGGSSTGVSLIS